MVTLRNSDAFDSTTEVKVGWNKHRAVPAEAMSNCRNCAVLVPAYKNSWTIRVPGRPVKISTNQATVQNYADHTCDRRRWISRQSSL